jgi:hypothetical protein
MGFDSEAGHVDLWPSVIDRLAKTCDRDARILRRLLKDRYYGLPRGRVTRPAGRSLVLHGRDAPRPDWEESVMRRFDLDPRSVGILYDEHETMMAEDRRRVTAALGLTPFLSATVGPEEPHPR